MITCSIASRANYPLKVIASSQEITSLMDNPPA